MLTAVTYTGLSVVFLGLCLGSTHNVLVSRELALGGSGEWSLPLALKFVQAFFASKLNVVAVINMGYNCLLLFGLFVSSRLFGALSDDERKVLKDNLVHFFLFRVVFMGAILDVDIQEFMVWTVWFSVFAFLRVFVLLARERFQSISQHPLTPLRTFYVLLALVVFIACVDVAIAGACLWLFPPAEAGWSVLLLLLFENVVLFIGCVKVVLKYAVHLVSLARDSTWQERGAYIYYIEFYTESAILVCTVLHFLHVWSMYGVSFTLIDLFLFMNLRNVTTSLHKRVVSFRNYRRAMTAINTRYEDATREELLRVNDNCAICRDRMESAKKLPCGHLFHRACLQQWIKYQRICPICRAGLFQPPNAHHNRFNNQNAAAAPGAGAAAAAAPGGGAGAAAAPAAPNGHHANGHNHAGSGAVASATSASGAAAGGGAAARQPTPRPQPQPQAFRIADLGGAAAAAAPPPPPPPAPAPTGEEEDFEFPNPFDWTPPPPPPPPQPPRGGPRPPGGPPGSAPGGGGVMAGAAGGAGADGVAVEDGGAAGGGGGGAGGAGGGGAHTVGFRGRSLFRFNTAGWLPNWFPSSFLPNFSFEVIRSVNPILTAQNHFNPQQFHNANGAGAGSVAADGGGAGGNAGAAAGAGGDGDGADPLDGLDGAGDGDGDEDAALRRAIAESLASANGNAIANPTAASTSAPPTTATFTATPTRDEHTSTAPTASDDASASASASASGSSQLQSQSSAAVSAEEQRRRREMMFAAAQKRLTTTAAPTATQPTASSTTSDAPNSANSVQP